jgi:hypothetical protein
LTTAAKYLKSRLNFPLQRNGSANVLAFFAILLAQMFCAAPLARATTYYVDVTNGNNSWSGTSSRHEGGMVGPWLNFAHINHGGTRQLQPGDVVYAMAGVLEHSGDSMATSLFLAPLAGHALGGTSNNPIVISNYPGAYFTISNSGRNVSTISLSHCSWIKIFGINETNAYRGACVQYCTNCEIACCDFGGGNTNFGNLCPFTMYNCSQSNWIHNNTVHDALATPVGDSTHCLTVGMFYSTNDWTSFNIIESNVCYHAGHDALSCYGPSNLIRNNFVHNENWYFRTDFQHESSHRCMEIGGEVGVGNVIEGNRLQYAGYNKNVPHGLECDGAGSSIIRNNVFSDNNYSGLTIYGGKVSNAFHEGGKLVRLYWGGNHVYNNTIAKNGFGAQSVVLYSNGLPGKTIPESQWLPAVTIAHSTNNVFVNNLLWGNWRNAIVGAAEPTSVAVGLEKRNISYPAAAPIFRDTNDGGPWSGTLPDYSLAGGSPAIDAGTWLTTITSASGAGTSFAVADGNYFFAGMTAATRTVPGDTIQLQAQTARATIVAISGNVITVDRPVTWAKGQGVAQAYSGAAPDLGAFEFGLTAAAPSE